MEQLVEYLISYGSYGMFVAAFLAGSFFPFSSELVMLGLLGIGAAPDELLIWATAGNTLGVQLRHRFLGTRGMDYALVQGVARAAPQEPQRRAPLRRVGGSAGVGADTRQRHHRGDGFSARALHLRHRHRCRRQIRALLAAHPGLSPSRRLR